MKLAYIVAALFSVILGLILLRKNGMPPTSRAMKQAARDPEYMAEVAERIHRKKRVQLPSTVTDTNIRDWVERLLDEEDADMVFPKQNLKLVGARAKPWLLSALDDPRYRQKSPDRNVWSDTPFETVVELLAGFGSDKLVDHLAPLLDSAEKHDRKLAALNIAHVGNDSSIPLVIRALDDPDKYVRSHAVMGVRRAVESAHALPQFLETMFQAMIPMAAGEVERDEGDAVECLVEIDQNRALAMLQTDRFLNVNNRELSKVLKVLNRNGVAMERAKLWPILERAKSSPDKYPWSYIYAEVLVMLAAQADESLQREIKIAMESEVERVYKGAVEALLRTEQLPAPSEFTFAFNGKDFDAASKPEQYLCAIMNLEAEVNNGGFSQYFFNSAGNEWPMALKGAKAVAAAGLQSQLEQAVAVFGKKGPSLDHDRRRTQYAKLSDETEKTLDDLSSEFYKDADRLEVLLAKYMIHHKDSIRARRK